MRQKDIKFGDIHIPKQFLRLKQPSIYLEKINKTGAKLDNLLVKAFEKEYWNYLKNQKSYEIEFQMKEKSIEIKMKRRSFDFSLPSEINVLIFTANNNEIKIIFDKNPKYERTYSENIIKKFINSKRDTKIPEQNNSENSYTGITKIIRI